MDIDYVIAKYKERSEFYKGTTNVAYGLELEQIAEWLEELKFIRRWKSYIVEDFCKYDASSIDEIVRNARNKAINDFAEKISTYGTYDHYGNTINVLEIAEQMKAN